MQPSPNSPTDRPGWAALSQSLQRDLLGAWATLVLEMLRVERRVEVGDERQGSADSPGASRRHLPAPVRSPPDARSSGVDRAPVRATATRGRAGLARRSR